MQTSNNGKNILHSLLFALDLANRKLDEQFCRKTLLMVDSDDDFYDDLGVQFPSGGLFAIRRPMPVRLVELQFDDQSSMIGLVAIRKSDSQ